MSSATPMSHRQTHRRIRLSPLGNSGDTNPADKAKREPWHTLHLALPWDLSDARVDINDSAITDALLHIFPTTAAVLLGNDRAFVAFSVGELPSPPWPKTIGGLLPIILPRSSSDGQVHCLFNAPSVPFVGGKHAHVVGAGSARFTRPTPDFTLGTVRVMAALVRDRVRILNPRISIHDIVVTVEHVMYVFVQDEWFSTREGFSALANLVGYIGSVRVVYGKESTHGSLSALACARVTEPDLPDQRIGIVDNTPYDILRPGVVITSKIKGSTTASASTTSGVLVKDVNGNIFMTSAPHGVGPANEIYLPSRPSRIIGDAEASIPATNVCLVGLRDNVSFKNKPFHFDDPEAPTDFTRMATDADIRLADACYMETPYTGLAVGSVWALSVSVEGSLPCTSFLWMFLGQDPGTGEPIRPPDSVCGSAIWNREGIIYGFYHWYSDSPGSVGHGTSLCVPASELTNLGFGLV